MKRGLWITAIMLAALTAAPAATQADYFVIGGGGGRPLGTAINTVPCVINTPGFYYLGQNLTSTGHGIVVFCSDVTIDLMGFTLTGPGKTSGENHGIFIQSNVLNVEIRNGSLRSFGAIGINSDVSCAGLRVVGLRVRDMGKTGIYLDGYSNMVMDCSAINNGESGIGVGTGSLVKGCQVGGNGSNGIYLSDGSTAIGNTSQSNSLGIYISSGSTAIDNSVYNNSQFGIRGMEGCTVSRNTVRGNCVYDGIFVAYDSTITNNTAQKGVIYSNNCTVVNNTVY